MERRLTHLGVIMDGNRRWARKNMLGSALGGHRRGTQVFVDLCGWCIDEGIPFLTAYAFSTENWERSREEVAGIFTLMEEFFTKEIGRCVEMGIKIKVIGNLSMLSERSLRTVREAERLTAGCDKLLAQLAISYGGRDELVRAAGRLCADALAREVDFASLNEETFAKYLDTAGVPDVDLVIRAGAGGRRRLSNFLPWQTAYAELYFTDVLWPDFTKAELARAAEFYRGETINKGV